MVSFIDRYREDWGVEPICAVLPIAPSTYYRCKELERSPQCRCGRARRDEWLGEEIARVWRVLKSMHTELVLDALEQALWARGKPKGVIHHSDRGSQYLSIRYTERLAEAGLTASVGSVGDSYDNALAETINGLYKAEVIYKDGPWRTMEQVERWLRLPEQFFSFLKWICSPCYAAFCGSSELK